MGLRSDIKGLLRELRGTRAFGKYQRTGRPEALDVAVTAFRDAVAGTPPGHPVLAIFLSNLGNALRVRFERAGDAGDIDAAVEACRRAADLTPPGDPDLAGILSNLGVSLLRRFERAGDAGDLDAAVEACRRAADLIPPGDPDLAGILSNLGVSLLRRFERAGDAGDLDAAIDAVRRAADLTPPGHPGLAMLLSNLGGSLRARFERAGDAADLDAAIDAVRRAADLTPPGHRDLAMYLSNLGVSLRTRFERAGDAADLDAAIDAGRRAVDLIPPGHPDLAAYLSNLGDALRVRFERAGDAGDLDAAINVVRRAVDLIPPGHQSRAGILSNLGLALRARFERAGDAGDLDAAIDAGRRAAALTPPGHAGAAPRLCRTWGSPCAPGSSGLGTPETSTARSSSAGGPRASPRPAAPAAPGSCRTWKAPWSPGSSGPGTRATSTPRSTPAGEAADLTPPGHPGLAGHLSNLGLALRARFERAGDVGDLDAAIGCWRQASDVPAGTPSVRLAAARAWGEAAAAAGRTREAAEGYAAAVGLLPTTAWHGLDRATREEHLAQWAGLAADAAACAILDTRPGLAVELLEQGRSVLWTQSLNLRSDLSLLADKAPGLAERLDSIRVILDSPVPEMTPARSEQAASGVWEPVRAQQQQDAAELRRRKAREWDEVLDQVRALPGFGHFLAAVPYADLKSAAADGPVVIVNASSYGCHALIVDPGREQPRVAILPDLSLEAAAEHANELLAALAGADDPGRSFLDQEKDRRAVLDVLDWLWDVIGGPVLTAVGYTGAPGAGSPWPRVWWCPTGPLAALPIHAAGHHPRLRTTATGSADSVPDRVISSYTPTLTALARARQPAAAAPVRHLTVGMPDAPGLPPLPAVPAELKVLARALPPGKDNHQLTGPQATRAEVLAAIAGHSWVHLACHAGQQDADPARSGFALWDGTATIADLAAQPTQSRDLAFLSACQTAAGSVRHLDEAIHLAAAMQFLGYRHVIATMWTIPDSPAPRVADTFYTALEPHGQPDPGQTAEALHHAIGALRQADPTDPPLWAPYIHLGI